MYDPREGRFLQTDPIGYDDQINLYAYVANDPVNAVDPTGTDGACSYTANACGMRATGGVAERQITAGKVMGVAAGIVAVAAGTALVAEAAVATGTKIFQKAEVAIAKEVAKSQGKAKGYGPPTRSDSGRGMKVGDGKGNQIRVEPGDPKSPHSAQRTPYVKVSDGGVRGPGGVKIEQTSTTPRPSAAPEAHMRAWKWVKETLGF